nr:disease resistance protein (TIR-NBS-LRR class) family [Tanacetum cinerariifolium]
MASSSKSSVPKSFKYDVFLSFRGEDTRKNFVDHLYQALKDKGIYTYKDDEKIQKGKTISDDLIQSIEDSKFYIIVFSKSYASSSWCLDELVKIMECHKMPEHTAYPVFYDVEPTEVRNQSGSVRKAFFKNKNKAGAVKWKGALKEAADLAGWELKNTLDGHEAKFIKKIVQEISLELCSINFGFDEMLGMGGSGKTTTTRAVFDHLSNHFEARSFVENVREVSNGSMSGLKKLQEQVLSDVLNEQVTVNGVTDGKNMMKRRMCGIKVLLVLDDVDHIEQLKALAGEPKWFKPGSRILITTRDEQVLVAHRVNLIRDIDLLSDTEAICLLSRYAFGRENPLQGYEALSVNVVRYAAGLPLRVKVLGSFLCGKDKLEWVDAIDRLEKIPLKDTLEKLELSYISLEDEYKNIFLDIACILKGERKEYAIRVLECCGFNARIGLKVLQQRSLITISKDEVLGMHDHIEEMGKHIARRSRPDEPNKHSRLWINEEIEDILANDMGTHATKCVKLNMSSGNARILLKGLGKMKRHRISNSSTTSISVSVACPNLKFLNLNKLRLRRLDLELIPNLERLCLADCGELVEINAPVGCLKKVVYLNLSGCLRFTDFVFLGRSEPKVNCSSATLHLVGECLNLCPLHPNSNLPKLQFRCFYSEDLPSSVGNIEKLISFGLCACTDLKKISDIICSLQCLKKLTLKCNINIPEFPKDLGRLECLEELFLYSRKIKHLPDKRPKSLEVNNSVLLEKLPEDLGQLECLEKLYVSSKKIEYLPDSICMLKRLKWLYVIECCLEKLPEDIGQLESLERLLLWGTTVKHLPDSICMLKHLKFLNLRYCALLEKLPEDLACLRHVVWASLIVSPRTAEYS